jgi:hypothetical protein
VKPGVSGKLAFAASYRIDRHSIEDIVECCELGPRPATKIWMAQRDLATLGADRAPGPASTHPRNNNRLCAAFWCEDFMPLIRLARVGIFGNPQIPNGSYGSSQKQCSYGPES